MNRFLLFIICLCAGVSGIAQDNCSSAVSVSNGVTENADNAGASADPTICGSYATVWYTITPGSNDDYIEVDISLTGMMSFVLEIYDACGGNLIFSSPCNETVSMTYSDICIDPSTDLWVAIGSQSGDEGAFDITITTTDNGFTETCDDLGAPVLLGCDQSFSDNGESTACPDDNEATGCMSGLGGVWFSFEVTAEVPEFTIDGNDYELFDGSCASLNPLSDCGMNDVITADPNATYYVLVNGNFTVTTPASPSNDDCSNATDASGGSLTGEDNLCASSDGTGACGADEATVWYEYTVANDATELDISVTPGSIANPYVAVFDGCGGNFIGQDCNGAIIIQCLIAGTYLIEVGSLSADAGDFDLTITETTSGVANEECATAEVLTLTETPCGNPNIFPGDNTGACPETFTAGACDFSLGPIVWFEFTVGPNTVEIDLDITGATFSEVVTILDGCPPSASYIYCGGSMGADIPVTSGMTYYLAVGSDDGGESTFDIEITEEEFVTNDDCIFAADLSSGSLTNETNMCATADVTFCGSQSDATVWYYYTLNDDAVTLDISVSANTMNNPAISVWTGCGETMLGEDCSGSIQVPCLSMGTYFIQVGSASGDEGTFDISVTETPSVIPNDACSGTLVDVKPSNSCVFETFSGDNSNACPESSTLNTSCAFDQNATVWFEFTTFANTNTVIFDNLTNGVQMAVFVSACPVGTPEGGDCFTNSDTPVNLPVSSSTTYYIAAALPGGSEGSFDFDMSFIEPPGNDECTGAFDVNSGMGTTTCCASPDGGGDVEASVWMEYVPGSADAVIINVDNIDIAGNGLIEVYTGSSCPPALLEQYMGGLGSHEFVISCLTGDPIYVKVGSTANGCGNFSITAVEESLACNNAETCNDVSSEVLDPTTGGGAVCYQACTTHACDEGDCGGDNSIWFQVNTDDQAATMFVEVNAPFTHQVSVYSGDDCSNLSLTTVSCSFDSPVDMGVFANTTYWVVVEVFNDDPGDVEVCVQTEEILTNCAILSKLTPERPEYPSAPQNGPYCPGEVVTFCYELTYLVSTQPPPAGNNCQWIQGIIPTIGPGWDEDAIAISDQGPGGEWFWLDEENVDYNVSNPVLEVVTLPNGNLGIEYGLGGGLSPGDLLPGGWWAVENGPAGQCANDGDPDTMYGLNAGTCNGTQDVDFCFDLQVREIDDIADCSDPDDISLFVGLYTFADGETGCWQSAICALDVPAEFNSSIDCTSLVEVIYEGETEICTGDFLNITVETIDGSDLMIEVEVQDNPNVDGENDHTFDNGMGIIADQLTNTGDDVEVVIYEAYSTNGMSVCNGPVTEIEVIVYPDILVEFENPYFICFGEQQVIEPEVSGGNGGPYTYEWQDGSSDNSILLPENIPTNPGDYEFAVTVTDNLGCEGEGLLLFEVVEPIDPEIDKDDDFVCKDGIDDFPTLTLEHDDVGTGPYTYEWDSNPNGLDFENGDDEQILIINDEESSSGNYTIIGTVIDSRGCEYAVTTQFTVDAGPELYFEANECYENGFEIEGGNFEVEPVTLSIWYDEEGDYYIEDGEIEDADLVDGPVYGNNLITFVEAFGLYILQGQTDNGCSSFVELNIPPIPIPIIDVIPDTSVCLGTTLTLTVVNDDAFDELTWSNGIEGPMITVTPMDTTTYSVEGEDDNFCVVTQSVTINVNPLPNVNISGSTSFCPGTSTTLTVSGDTSSAFLWTAPDGTVFTTKSVQASQVGLWTVEVTTAQGCVNSGSVMVTEDNQLNPNVTGGDICTGESVTLDAGPGFDLYNWFDPDGDQILPGAQTITVSQGGTYTVSVLLGNCAGTGQYTVFESTPLGPGLNTNMITVCNEDTGLGPTSIDLTAYQNLMGTWFNQNGIPVADPTNVDFTGAAVSTLTYTFTTSEAIAPCQDTTYNFAIIVDDCGCPSVDINNIRNFCVGTDTFNLALIKITDEDGSWSISGGGDPSSLEILTNQYVITNSNTVPGDYFLTFTLDSMAPPACSMDTTVAFSVFAKPEVNLVNNMTVCNEDTGNGPDSLDLDDLYVSGSPGIWSTNTMGLVINAENVVSFAGQAVGTYTFFYLTNDATAPCKDTTYSIKVIVEDCSCPPISVNPFNPLCNSGGLFELNDFLNNPDGLPGAWSVDGPDPTTLSGSTFNANGASAGDYTVTFTFDPPPGGFCTISASQAIIILDEPSADVVRDTTVCNGDNVTPYPMEIDFNGLVSGSLGTWTAPSGYNGGVIDNLGAVNFMDVNPGIYQFTFTTNTATPPCVDQVYQMNVTVTDCNCPEIQLITPPVLCNEDSSIDLDNLVFPGVGDGVWLWISPPPEATGDEIDGTVFTPAGLPPGQYTFMYSLNDLPPAGCTSTAEVTIEVNAPPVVEAISDTLVCNAESVLGPNCIDLSNLVTGASGTWTAPGNYSGDFSDITNICFDGFAPGSTYTFAFLTNVAEEPCADKQVETTVTVADCNCPNVTVFNPDPICNDGGSLDLTTLESTNIEDGTWSVVSGPQTIDLVNSIFDATGVLDGDYLLQYTPDVPPAADCDPWSQVILTVSNAFDGGIASNTSVCINQPEVFNLYDLLDGEDTGGIWQETSANPSSGTAFDPSSGVFNTNSQDAGDYSFTYSFLGQAPCPDVIVEVMVIVDPEPAADAGQDQELNCAISQVSLGGPPMTGLSYQWLDANGNPVPNGNAATLTVTQPGTYILEVQDITTGCISMDQVVVGIDPELPSFETVVENSPCFGDNNGSIQIINPQGGDGNYQYSIDSGQNFTANTLFTGLAPGGYVVVMQDGQGCQTSSPELIIVEPGPFSVDAGEDQTLSFGETYTISLSMTIDPASIASIVWTANGVEICSGSTFDCLELEVDPDELVEYCVIITDVNGCEASDCVILRERIVRDVYIPNIFSPNDDGNNDVFYIQTDEFVTGIPEFRIYDRWGELVYFFENGVPNDPFYGWDGQFNNKDAVPGVYVYYIEVQYNNADTESFAGDITLLR